MQTKARYQLPVKPGLHGKDQKAKSKTIDETLKRMDPSETGTISLYLCKDINNILFQLMCAIKPCNEQSNILQEDSFGLLVTGKMLKGELN